MKQALYLLLFSILIVGANAQQISTSSKDVNAAFDLAVWTIDHNTHRGIIEAGAGYGGEWTRDCALNSWNCMSLLRPQVAEKSLWSVTEGQGMVSHQYWDKIIWVIAAWNHYLATGDREFLAKAYACSAATMSAMEDSCFDPKANLFRGPAFFQDGIAGYETPIYDPKKWDDSYVLHHENSKNIKCFSTNLLYAEAYRSLMLMAELEEPARADYYRSMSGLVFESVKRNFYDGEAYRLYYLIDPDGKRHAFQEGTGAAFAMLFDLLDDEEAFELNDHIYSTPYGIPCVWPSFRRFSPEKPGRHNVMIWPHVNMLYAAGCAHKHVELPFYKELRSLASLAASRKCFYEIYTIDGEPSGGWQCGSLWAPKEHQTWGATGFIHAVVSHIFGITLTQEGIKFDPIGMQDGSECRLSGIQYRKADIEVVVHGHGPCIAHCSINGRESAPFLPADAVGSFQVEVFLK